MLFAGILAGSVEYPNVYRKILGSGHTEFDRLFTALTEIPSVGRHKYEYYLVGIVHRVFYVALTTPGVNLGFLAALTDSMLKLGKANFSYGDIIDSVTNRYDSIVRQVKDGDSFETIAEDWPDRTMDQLTYDLKRH